MRGRLIACLTILLTIAASAALTQAPGPAGEQVFKDRCASCHSAAADSRAPAPEALRSRSPQAVVESLVNGAMRVQGSRMTGAERRAVAEYITGRALDGDVAGGATGRCLANQQPDRTGGGGWRGWSPAPTNTRFQPVEDASLGIGEIPKLTLKWAFAFPDA